MLKLAGISLADEHEASYSADELRAILLTSAQAGHISSRQKQFGNFSIAPGKRCDIHR
jgi:hypothetical protein